MNVNLIMTTELFAYWKIIIIFGIVGILFWFSKWILTYTFQKPQYKSLWEFCLGKLLLGLVVHSPVAMIYCFKCFFRVHVYCNNIFSAIAVHHTAFITSTIQELLCNPYGLSFSTLVLLIKATILFSTSGNAPLCTCSSYNSHSVCAIWINCFYWYAIDL